MPGRHYVCSGFSIWGFTVALVNWTSAAAKWLLIVAVLPALLVACESDQKKLERLQMEGARASLAVMSWQYRNAEGRGSTDSLRAAENALILHERRMARFLSGR